MNNCETKKIVESLVFCFVSHKNKSVAMLMTKTNNMIRQVVEG